MPVRVCIDTDPGLDDALAILAALRAPGLQVTGLATVAGNIGLGRTTRNAARLLALAGSPLAVHPGAASPLSRPHRDAAEIHGADGLGGVVLPDALRVPSDIHAAEFLAAEARAGATILALGPLTNLALMLRRNPGLIPARIIAMGGAIHVPGNMGPRAEFNIAADPEAAAVVLGAGVPLTLIPLDVTRQVRAGTGWADSLGDGPVARCVADLIAAFLTGEGGQSRPLHDPCTVLLALRPDLFRGQRMRLSVDLTDGPDMGALTATPDPASPVEVMLEVDAGAALDLLRDLLSGG